MDILGKLFNNGYTVDMSKMRDSEDAVKERISEDEVKVLTGKMEAAQKNLENASAGGDISQTLGALQEMFKPVGELGNVYFKGLGAIGSAMGVEKFDKDCQEVAEKVQSDFNKLSK